MKTFNIVYCPNPEFAQFRFCKNDKPQYKTTVDAESEDAARAQFSKFYPMAKLLTIA